VAGSWRGTRTAWPRKPAGRPLVQVDTDLYAIPAAVGAIVVAAAYRTDLSMPVVATGAAVSVFAFRIVAMLRHWRAPRAWAPRGSR
jgi:uncharacterized membrane protein YeiH